MAETNPTLNTFYESWKLYHDHLKEAIAPLTAEQLSLRAAPHLRSVGVIAAHIIAARVYWFNGFLAEGSDEITPLRHWDEHDQFAHDAAKLVHGLDLSWQLVADSLARWGPADLQQTFGRTWRGQRYELSRSWVVWHILEHDLHHGGEFSLTLGLHGLQAPAV